MATRADSHNNVDFEKLALLASTDPVGFEVWRRSLVEQFIDDAPPRYRTRLQRLQWRIDAERRRHKAPLGACVAISGMMWESVYGRNGLASALSDLLRTSSGLSESRQPQSATVLPLRGKPRPNE